MHHSRLRLTVRAQQLDMSGREYCHHMRTAVRLADEICRLPIDRMMSQLGGGWSGWMDHTLLLKFRQLQLELEWPAGRGAGSVMERIRKGKEAAEKRGIHNLAPWHQV